MKPIKFPEATVGMGELQPQFITLPMYIRPIDEQPESTVPRLEQVLKQATGQQSVQYLFKYEFSDFDIEQIVRLRCAWFSQFGNCFHPVLPQLENPFKHYIVEYEQDEHGLFHILIPTTDGKYVIKGVTAAVAIEMILQRFPELSLDAIRFEEKQKAVIDEEGNLKL